uniref:Uncharacterized protein n=1 Tax=Anguilla anguilla TaxID=7936 RepID=A0A0E9UW77_ANGAN
MERPFPVKIFLFLFFLFLPRPFFLSCLSEQRTGR